MKNVYVLCFFGPETGTIYPERQGWVAGHVIPLKHGFTPVVGADGSWSVKFSPGRRSPFLNSWVPFSFISK